MFARKVSVLLKPNSLRLFASLMECKILPWLRQQQGFLDLILLALPDGSEVATISFWDHEGNAQAYNATGYPEVVQILEELLDGIPYVETFEVVSSTFAGASPRVELSFRRSEGSRADYGLTSNTTPPFSEPPS